MMEIIYNWGKSTDQTDGVVAQFVHRPCPRTMLQCSSELAEKLQANRDQLINPSTWI